MFNIFSRNNKTVDTSAAPGPSVESHMVTEQQEMRLDESAKYGSNIGMSQPRMGKGKNYAHVAAADMGKVNMLGDPIPGSHKTSLVSKFFSYFSRYGMNYDGDIMRNMYAIPADPALLSKDFKQMNAGLLNSMQSAYMVKSNKDQNFTEKDFGAKRDVLRNLAVQPELEDIIDMMTNECVVYDKNDKYICEAFIDDTYLKKFKPDFVEKIHENISSIFYDMYLRLNWSRTAWDDFKKWLIEGILAYEIVWDNLKKPTKIIGIIPVDPATLTQTVKNGKKYWVQFAGVTGKERVFLDSQIIYVPYQETNSVMRTSYLERLIRPFNIYRIIEQAQIIWTLTNASYKMCFTIPVGGMSRQKSDQTIGTLINQYHENISFNTDTGELMVNGKPNMPFNKEYWMPESDSGKPEIETLGGDGPELNDNDQLRYFKQQLYKQSKIPMSRFDTDADQSWFGTDAQSYARDEINFSRFVKRLRNQFSIIMLKPLQLQLAVMMPELQESMEVLNSISLNFNSYNQFEEMMDDDLMQKRIDFIQAMKDALVDTDADGNEIKFFSSEFLVKKYLHWTEDDLKENYKLKDEEASKLKAVDSNAPDADSGGASGGGASKGGGFGF